MSTNLPMTVGILRFAVVAGERPPIVAEGEMIEAAAQSDGSNASWWYQQADETRGPVTENELRSLRLAPSTQVWHASFGDEWKAFSDALPNRSWLLAHSEQSDLSEKWKRRFAKIEGTEPPHYSFNVWGLFFNFLYYFYLRMWKKGFVILGFSLWATILWAAVGAILNLNEIPPVLLFLPSVFCALFVNGDYFKFKRQGETMWALFSKVDRPWIIGVFVLVPLVFSVVLGAWAEANAKQSDADDKRAFVIDPPKLKKWSTDKGMASGSGMVSSDQRAKASDNCKQWLLDRFGGTFTDQYEPNLARRYAVDFTGGSFIQDRMYFGGHRALFFMATLNVYRNGQLESGTGLPQRYCVLNDNLDVIGAETDIQVTGMP